MSMFSLQGTYNRTQFLKVTSIWLVGTFAVSFIIGFTLGQTPLLTALTAIIGLVCTWAFIAATVKRMRSVNISKWAMVLFSILGCIPLLCFVNLVWFVIPPKNQ